MNIACPVKRTVTSQPPIRTTLLIHRLRSESSPMVSLAMTLPSGTKYGKLNGGAEAVGYKHALLQVSDVVMFIMYYVYIYLFYFMCLFYFFLFVYNRTLTLFLTHHCRVHIMKLKLPWLAKPISVPPPSPPTFPTIYSQSNQNSM